MKLRFAAFILLACLVPLAGCKAKTAVPRSDVQATESAFGTTLTLKLGQTLDLALPDNASTGYQWRISWTPQTALTLQQSVYVGLGDQRQPGSGGIKHCLFRALQPGKAVIRAQHGRWWQGGDKEPLRKLVLQVTR